MGLIPSQQIEIYFDDKSIVGIRQISLIYNNVNKDIQTHVVREDGSPTKYSADIDIQTHSGNLAKLDILYEILKRQL